jgi:hypothetical protein
MIVKDFIVGDNAGCTSVSVRRLVDGLTFVLGGSCVSSVTQTVSFPFTLINQSKFAILDVPNKNLNTRTSESFSVDASSQTPGM